MAPTERVLKGLKQKLRDFCLSHGSDAVSRLPHSVIVKRASEPPESQEHGVTHRHGCLEVWLIMEQPSETDKTHVALVGAFSQLLFDYVHARVFLPLA